MTSSGDIIDVIGQIGGDPADLPFWEGCGEGRFLLHRCGICARHYWPASRCVEHGDRDMAWVESSGTGSIYTYTVQHHAYRPEMRDRVPYAIAVVKLTEGPFFHTNIVDHPATEVAVGLAVKAKFVRAENGLVLPMFAPA